MPEETLPLQEETSDKSAPATEAAAPKKAGKWFGKIPKEILFSPGGVFLIFFALFMEILDLIPVPVVDQIWELPFEIFFVFLLSLIAKIPFTASIIPLVIERIPVINDIIPTWIIRLFL